MSKVERQGDGVFGSKNWLDPSTKPCRPAVTEKGWNKLQVSNLWAMDALLQHVASTTLASVVQFAEFDTAVWP
jgi:hypothetical protein